MSFPVQVSLSLKRRPGVAPFGHGLVDEPRAWGAGRETGGLWRRPPSPRQASSPVRTVLHIGDFAGKGIGSFWRRPLAFFLECVSFGQPGCVRAAYSMSYRSRHCVKRCIGANRWSRAESFYCASSQVTDTASSTLCWPASRGTTAAAVRFAAILYAGGAGEVAAEMPRTAPSFSPSAST